MNEWTNNWQQPLVARPGCCEEASLQSIKHYIPCNAPAINIVGWIGRNDKPIRMCEMCTDHNVKNRGGYIAEAINPTPSNPLDAMNEDQLLLLWQKKKDAIEVAKEEEMELRKYIVKREFPAKHEGMNTKVLGNGYQLKAGIKYNYNLADNDTVESCLDRISRLGNDGAFIADRLVSWKPNFLLVEYRQLCEDKDKGSKFAEECLKIVNEFLTITDAAPSMEIKEPKAKKK